MKKTLERFAPPGFPYGFELSLFLWGLGLSFLYSLWFFADFFQALADFQTSIPFSGGVLYFGDLEFFLRHTKPWLGYVLLALVMAGCVIWNYSYHYQGSKSVYLMRRLPTPGRTICAA